MSSGRRKAASALRQVSGQEGQRVPCAGLTALEAAVADVELADLPVELRRGRRVVPAAGSVEVTFG